MLTARTAHSGRAASSLVNLSRALEECTRRWQHAHHFQQAGAIRPPPLPPRSVQIKPSATKSTDKIIVQTKAKKETTRFRPGKRRHASVIEAVRESTKTVDHLETGPSGVPAPAEHAEETAAVQQSPTQAIAEQPKALQPLSGRYDWRLRASSRSPSQRLLLRPSEISRKPMKSHLMKELEKAHKQTEQQTGGKVDSYVAKTQRLIGAERYATLCQVMQGKLDRVLQDLPFDTQPVLTGLTARTNGPTNPKRKSGKRTKEADPDTHEGPADDGRIGVSFSLSLPGRTFSELPEHSFRTNMIVIVRDGKPITPESPAWTARVTRVFKDSISLRSECFTPEIDAHSLFVPGKDQLYSIELAWDDASYKRQSLAVDLLSTDLQPQLSYNASIFTKRTGAAYKKYPEHPLLGTGLRDVILDDRLYAKGATDVPDFVASNQLLYSWVKRYTRSHPIVLEGDPVLDLNRTQIRAIAQSLSSRCALIQGPPGTGKSITIIEALRLLKVHFQVPQPILVCAPTHVAVDQLLARAVKAGLRPLRVGLEDKVSPSAEPYCMLAQVARHPFAEKLEVMSDRIRGLDHQRIGPAATPDEAVDTKFKRVLSSRYFLESLIWADICSNVDVIFSTCLGASVSHVASIDFPIVFIDEAAQCNEASTLVPLMKGSQQLVLIGDHKQLPSIAMSPDATQEGFNISLFERLMVSKRVPSVMLDTQYRMHPDISKFPNMAFYRGQLRDAPSTLKSKQAAIRSRFSPAGKSSALTFINCDGLEQKEGKSYINEGEAEEITLIVRDLLARNSDLRCSDIGIITPYAGQVHRLRRMMLQSWRFPAGARVDQIEVSSVDGFQGREKEVIVFSAVRSNKHSQLGFLSDRRRLNVALTRAKAALFVVGNALTLQGKTPASGATAVSPSKTPIWSRYMRFLEGKSRPDASAA